MTWSNENTAGQKLTLKDLEEALMEMGPPPVRFFNTVPVDTGLVIGPTTYLNPVHRPEPNETKEEWLARVSRDVTKFFEVKEPPISFGPLVMPPDLK